MSPGTCNDTFGTKTGTAALGAGTTPVVFSQAVAGLMPATTYYYCALGSNAQGLAVGSVRTFTTPSAPTALTTSAFGVSNTAATLSGEGTPNRTATAGWFRYSATAPAKCDDTFGSRAPTTGGVALGSGTTSTPYTQAVTGLSAGTTYYYCAIVSNSEGTAFGAVLSFTTAGGPTATSGAATAVTSGGATLNGSGNPNLASATGWFRFSPTSPAACSDTFGTRVPITSGTGVSLGAGSTSVPYSQGISGLLPGTTYFYCSIVSNAYGTAYGSLLSFTTSALAPTVVTSSASVTSGSAATLNGNATPNGDATTGWFRYAAVSPGTCNDTFGTKTASSALGAGTSPVVFSQVVAALMPATTYYYCALASNAQGLAMGNVRSFTTPSAPTALTTAAFGVSNTGATLSGAGTPNRTAASGWFRYSATAPAKCDDTFGSRAPTLGGVALGSGTTSTPYTQAVTGLSAGTTYYYCAIVSNSEGTAFGAVLSFITASAPTATTLAATPVAPTSATLNGSGNPNLAAATGWFRFNATSPAACNDTFGTRVPITSGTGVSLGAGNTSVPYSQGISGLLPGTTYFYCSIVSNAYGTRFGDLLSFTTPPIPPVVTTSSPSGLTSTTATLNGNANPSGAATSGWFRIDSTSPGTCNDTFGSRLPAVGGTSLGAGNSAVAFSEPATALTPGQVYYYCAIASNAAGTTFGSVRAFTAPLKPTVSTLAATPVTATTATLNGTANPNGNTTSGWFRYSSTNPGACTDAFGTRTPAAGGTNLGSGTAAVAYSQPISGLSPGTTYYFCAIAASPIGTTPGSVLAFTTPPDTPSATKGDPGSAGAHGDPALQVTTQEATEITPRSAVVNATVVLTGDATKAWFRYSTTDPGSCNDSFGMRVRESEDSALDAAAGALDFSHSLKDLAPGTTYYYCAIASSSRGTSFGAVLALTTRTAPPSTLTSPPTGVTGSAAVLNGAAVPNGEAATGWFRYSEKKPETCDDRFGVRVPADGGRELGAGVASIAWSESIGGLKPGQTYYYCAVTANSLGTGFGELVAFLPGAAAPVVSTDAAAQIEGTRALVAGTVNSNGRAAIGWFRYGEIDPGTCDDSFGSRAPARGELAIEAAEDPAAARAPVSELRAISASLNGLKPNTTYYYCAAASSLGGATFGQVLSFKTAPALAALKSVEVAAEGLGVFSVKSTAEPMGSETRTWLRIDTTHPGTCNDSFGTRTPSVTGSALLPGRTAVQFQQRVSDLAPGTYYACAIAVNAAGVSYSEVQTFHVSEAEAASGCSYASGSRAHGSGLVLLSLLPLLGCLLLRRRRRSI